MYGGNQGSNYPGYGGGYPGGGAPGGYPGGAPGGYPGAGAPGGYPGGGPPIGFDAAGAYATGGGYQSGYSSYPNAPAPGFAGGGASGYPSSYPTAGGGGYPTGPSGGYAPAPPSGGYPTGPSYGYPAGAPSGYPTAAPTSGYPAPHTASYPAAGGGGYGATAGYPSAPGGYPTGQVGGGYYPASTAPSGYATTPTYQNQSYASHTGAHTGALGPCGEQGTGTLRPTVNFNVESDCNILRKAMRGLGTDEQAIINVLGKRNVRERQQIKTMYKTMFGKDLIKELKSELSGRFESITLALLMDSAVYDAYCLREAMRGIGTKESVLTEIICTRTNQQLRAIKEAYKREYNRDLEKDVTSETSYFFRRVLVSTLQANRCELTPQQMQGLATQGSAAVVDLGLAQREAQELLQAGEKQIGTDESVFIRILAIRNMYQLRATFDEYRRIANRDIFTTIDREMSGDLADALKALAMAQVNRPAYFAKRLYQSMKGLGTSDSTLIRVIVTRSEIDLSDIKQEFQRNYGKSLESYIVDDTSGDYKRMLLAIVQGN